MSCSSLTWVPALFASNYREIYKSVRGETAAHAEIEDEVLRVKSLVDKVKASVESSLSKGLSSSTEDQLRDFLLAWDTVAERLLQLLEDHKVKNTSGRRPFQVMKQVWRLEIGRSAKDNIDKLQTGLEKLQGLILLSLAAIIRSV